MLTTPQTVEQILLNLAVNAQDAMPRGGSITVRTRLVDEQGAHVEDASLARGALLEVQDTGTGIPEEHVDRIFQPFFTTKPPGRGTGLGLATVARLVEESHGAVTVSTAVGQGTRFRIVLPLTDRPVETGPAPHGREGGEGQGARVLVVDDEHAIRRIVARALTREGLEVIEAPTADQAVRVAREGPAPDLLLTDVTLPDRPGTELARELRGSMPGLRVLYMSGYPLAEEDEHLPFEGRPSFIGKPFTPAEIVAAVSRALAAN